ncbi:MAG: hypothetical protein K2W95_31425 [Candidatus Obscuribacterales bacterium]|nr:hypothetical protein [Candidatus Obscuribacterales bacterium]
MVKNEQGWQHLVVLFSLPIFAILSVQKAEASNGMVVEDRGVCIQLPHSSLQLSPAHFGNSAGGGPLRVLGFIARAAKSRRRDDAGEGLTRSTEPVMIRQMITTSY